MLSRATRAGRFVLPLLVALGGLACSGSGAVSGRTGGAGGRAGNGAAGAGGIGGGAGTGTAGAGGGAMGGGGAGGNAAGGAAGGATGPIVGTPLGTFDTGLDSFGLYRDQTSGLIVGINAIQYNLGDDTRGLPHADLSWDATEGSPTPGSLKVSAPYSGASGEYVQIASAVVGSSDWSGHTLHARVRVASGRFGGVAQLYVSSNPGFEYDWSTASIPSDGSWFELTLLVSHTQGFDPTRILELGLQLHVGDNIGETPGPVVFNVDSFSIDPPVALPDAATDSGP
jgi:hypothetical protein